MGVKIGENVNPLEASIEDGYLSVYFFDEVINRVDLSIPKNIKMERQCNFVRTPMQKVIGFLRNDKFIVIIRVDGTVDVLSKDFILLFKSRVNTAEIYDRLLFTCYAGSLSLFGGMHPAQLVETRDKKVFIYSYEVAVTILLDLTDETSYAVYKWAKKYDDVGTMYIVDNGTSGNHLWANFGLNEYHQLHKFKCIKSDGFIGGINR